MLAQKMVLAPSHTMSSRGPKWPWFRIYPHGLMQGYCRENTWESQALVRQLCPALPCLPVFWESWEGGVVPAIENFTPAGSSTFAHCGHVAMRTLQRQAGIYLAASDVRGGAYCGPRLRVLS